MRPRISRTVVEKVEPNGRVQQIKKEIAQVDKRIHAIKQEQLKAKQIKYCQSRLSLAATAILQDNQERADFFLSSAKQLLVTEELKEQYNKVVEMLGDSLLKYFK